MLKLSISDIPVGNLIRSKVFYHCEQPLSLQTSDDFMPAASPVDKAWLVVVGKKHYTEWVRKYPISDLSELKKVVANESSADAFSFYQIGPVQNNQRQVQCWQIDATLAAVYPNALVWLPESVVLAADLAENQLFTIQTPTAVMFLHQQQGNVRSALQTAMLPFESLFAASIGVNALTSQQLELSPALMHQGLRRLPVAALSTFWRWPVHQEWQGLAKATVIATASVGIAYNLLVSAWLYSQNAYFEQEKQGQQQQVGELLARQNDMQQLQELIAAQHAVLRGKAYSAHIWQLVAELLQQKAELNRLDYNDNAWVMKGKVASATALLQALQQHPLVQTAAFDSAVRRQSDMDEFSVRLVLKQQGGLSEQNQ